MDVQTSDFVKGLIKEELIGRQGKTIIFISHELYEMENFCDRVAILADGRIQVIGTPAELGAHLPRRALYRVVVHGDSAAISRQWNQIDGVESIAMISQGTATTAYDVAMADEAAWLSVMEAVAGCGGRVESYHRAEDQSLRRIVAHFSNDALAGGYEEAQASGLDAEHQER
jgi:ABC-2 type transport system ATP-binding protein